jgi:hypothetical protein
MWKNRHIRYYLPAILQPATINQNVGEILSLEMLKELHINNTKSIELLKTEKKEHQLITYSTLVIMMIILAVVTAKMLFCRQKNAAVEIKLNHTPEKQPKQSPVRQDTTKKTL